MMKPWRCVFVVGLAALGLFSIPSLVSAQAVRDSDRQPPSNATVGTKWTSPRDGREMVWIPPGEFLMGSPTSETGRNPPHNVQGNTWDESQHRVRVATGFWMDAAEVTNEAYQKFVLANPAWQKDRIDPKLHGEGYYLKDWSGTDYPAGKGRYPAVGVSWHAARAYCRWAGKRLPTEAEWEYAARAGTTSAYWWGDTFDGSRANANNIEEVGNPRRTNPWGLADMIGNVQEWTSSLNEPYPYRADDGRENPDASGLRDVRGGGRHNGPVWMRSAVRTGYAPKFATGRLGMRCVQ
jgi:formylglycine-generating enzyme required for sulfatase activity